MADHPFLEALYTQASSLPCNDVPAVRDSPSSFVRSGFDGGEFVTPDIQFSTECRAILLYTEVPPLLFVVDKAGAKLDVSKKLAANMNNVNNSVVFEDRGDVDFQAFIVQGKQHLTKDFCEQS